MKVLLQAIALLFTITTCSQAMETPSSERKISSTEILASFESIKEKATLYYSQCFLIDESTYNQTKAALYSATLYTLRLGHEIIQRVIANEVNTKEAIDLITSSIAQNDPFKNQQPLLHQNLIELFNTAYKQHATRLPQNPTQRDIMLFYFDIIKDVTRTISIRWGFDVRTALY